MTISSEVSMELVGTNAQWEAEQPRNNILNGILSLNVVSFGSVCLEWDDS